MRMETQWAYALVVHACAVVRAVLMAHPTLQLLPSRTFLRILRRDITDALQTMRYGCGRSKNDGLSSGTVFTHLLRKKAAKSGMVNRV